MTFTWKIDPRGYGRLNLHSSVKFAASCKKSERKQISLRQNSTIKSHDGGKGGHFCHCDGKRINFQLTRGVPLVGQLSLYLMTLIVYVVNLLKG